MGEGVQPPVPVEVDGKNIINLAHLLLLLIILDLIVDFCIIVRKYIYLVGNAY